MQQAKQLTLSLEDEIMLGEMADTAEQLAESVGQQIAFHYRGTYRYVPLKDVNAEQHTFEVEMPVRVTFRLRDVGVAAQSTDSLQRLCERRDGAEPVGYHIAGDLEEE